MGGVDARMRGRGGVTPQTFLLLPVLSAPVNEHLVYLPHLHYEYPVIISACVHPLIHQTLHCLLLSLYNALCEITGMPVYFGRPFNYPILLFLFLEPALVTYPFMHLSPSHLFLQ